MSVHPTTRNGMKRWLVRWREGDRQRSRTFTSAPDARAFDRELSRLRAQGELAQELDRRRVTVADLVGTWVNRRASMVSERTAENYGRNFARYVLPQLGNRSAHSITPGDVEEWIAWMRGQGAGDPTILHAAAALQAVLTIGVRDGLIPANPVAAAKKPRQQRTRVPQIVTVLQVEQMRHHALELGRERDAVLIELLAYAGLRPESEAVALHWRSVRERSLHVQGTKTGTERTLPMLDPLRETLAAWRIRSGRPPATALVVPPRAGDTWTRDEWRYWRRNRFAPLAKHAGLPEDTRPRDLRGSLASLLIHGGHSIVEVAAWLGHAPEVCLRDYAQILNEVDPDHRVAPAEAIRQARATVEQHDAAFHLSSTDTIERTA